ncbi:thiamine pyrophosphate-dependent dehydrogenase E1 component subunit alpha [Kordiimonas marina]|uniref:thiamine pyrophosphate-dependent dehydrogenase E1 component subunit alpha n=1 Tax=Kordiimonas marina TaxID=2872312 RepID=UPI001FF0F96B|nr:thiamine pyrophosphate-dependent dehydrogenase E1 component subunit alpha [Kordiimonas marina]MCJ9430107.1 thiamine pyrophosphate-dependent dehydrogenase E1 component subunit alpha [Kordiimonas marina]
MTLDDLKPLFEKAHFIRAFEHEIAALSEAGDVPGLVHLCLGAELFEVALCANLEGPGDQVTGSHRSHGLALAMGADPVAVAAEILGRTGGLSEGLGGTQHLLAPEVGFLTSNGIVGGQVPLAAGAALSAKTLKTGGIGVAVMGDGATNQGAVFETMNLAVALKLPLLFVIENNGLGQSTSAHYASGGISPMARARGFGLAASHVEGGDITGCLKTVDRLVSWVRETGSPALVEASVPRLSGHYHGDEQLYRSAADSQPDPLEQFEDTLLRAGATATECHTIKTGAHAAAKAAVTAANQQADTSDEAVARWATRLGGAA